MIAVHFIALIVSIGSLWSSAFSCCPYYSQIIKIDALVTLFEIAGVWLNNFFIESAWIIDGKRAALSCAHLVTESVNKKLDKKSITNKDFDDNKLKIGHPLIDW